MTPRRNGHGSSLPRREWPVLRLLVAMLVGLLLSLVGASRAAVDWRDVPVTPRRSPTAGASGPVRITVEAPVEDGAVVFQPIGPSSRSGPRRGRVSMRLRIDNVGDSPLRVNQVEILGKTTMLDAMGPTSIAPGSSWTFHNRSWTRNGKQASRAVLIEEPFPSRAVIRVFVEGSTPPVELRVPLRPHENDGGPLVFPGHAGDLRVNEAWGASSDHGSADEVFALDLALLGWVGDEWSELFAGARDLRPQVDPAADRPFYERESFRVYGMPLYAMASGSVCFAIGDHEEHETTRPRPAGSDATRSESLGRHVGRGNQIFVRSGEEIWAYAHLQKGSIPRELLAPGAAVRRGQYLGKVGYSGDSRQPHVHVHVKSDAERAARGSLERCDSGEFRPMTFETLQSLTKNEADSLAPNRLDPGMWARLWPPHAPYSYSAPHPYGLLYPSEDPFPFCPRCTDSRRFLGVWRAGDAIELRVNAPGWEDFEQRWKELTQDGFRLTTVEAFEDLDAATGGETTRFLGVFERGGGRHLLWSAAGWEAFAQKYAEVSEDGLRLVGVASFARGATRRYVGVFREGEDRHALLGATGWEEFTDRWKKETERGLRLIDVAVHPIGPNEHRFVGVFREARGTREAHALAAFPSWRELTRHWERVSAEGLRLVDLESYAVGGRRRYVAAYRQGEGAYALESLRGYARFVQSSEKYSSRDLRLVDVHIEP